MKNSKSILGVIFAAVLLTTMLFVQHQPLDTKSNELQALVIHCTATPEHVNATADQIGNYFLRSTEKGGRGWNKEGYHDIIEKDGRVVSRIEMDDDSIVSYSEIANGAAGYNRLARHVSYIGGLDRFRKPKNTLTEFQDSSLKRYVFDFLEKHPKAYVLGHNQIAAKACPSFNVPDKLREYGVNEDNIYKYKHRGKQIELLNDNSIVSRNAFLQSKILPKQISVHSKLVYQLANNNQGNHKGHGNIHAIRQCYSYCDA